jgi:hypothetical protein
MSPLSNSKPDRDAPEWLEAKVYEPKRQRTIHLVQQAVDVLREEKRRISLASVAARSKLLDPEGRGISESAILNNDEAHSYYEALRSWKGKPSSKQQKGARQTPDGQPSIRLERDIERVRQRYLRLGKQELVDRLIAIEQTYAEDRERWLQANDEILLWRLRVEQAERRTDAIIDADTNPNPL